MRAASIVSFEACGQDADVPATRRARINILLLPLLLVLVLMRVGSVHVAAQEAADRPSLTYLVIDRSGSIEASGLTDPIVGAITEFVGALPTNSELRVVFFSDRASKEQSWRPPLDARAKGEFIRRLQKDFRPAGETRLYDTVAEVLRSATADSGKFSKVDIKILSDGADNKSETFKNWRMLSDLTKQFGTGQKNFITWYTLGFDPKDRRPPADSGIVLELVPNPTKGFSLGLKPAEAKPVAAFDATPKTAKTHNQILFRLLYPKGVATATWSFGDGTSAEGTEIQHSYERPGTYSIKVQVEGPSGKDALEIGDFIQILEKIPVRAAFSASPRRAKIAEEVLFALDSPAGAMSVRWDFGDGTSATNSVARHAYSGSGTYIVKVAVAGSDSADSAQLTDGVEVFSELPVNASFSVSPRRATINEDVLFTLDSAAGVTSTRWDFGDGSSASNSLARHSYAKVGDYDIGVEASGPGGKDVALRKGYVQIRAEVPLEPVFSWAPKTVIAGQEVQMIDESVGGPTKWLWEIQGIGIRSERSPVIVFAKDEKVLVRLTVEKEGQRRSIAKDITVKAPPPPLLQARFEVAPATGRSPLKVQFTDRSAGVVAKYSWDFGDGERSDLRNPVHEYKLQRTAQSFHPRLAIADSTGQQAKDSGGIMISVVPPPPWWRWPLVGGLALFVLVGWFWQKNKPTVLVGRLKWQQPGHSKEPVELEGTSFDLGTLQLKAIPLGKYALRNLRGAGPYLMQEGREPKRLEHKQQFEVEGILFTYFEY